jgi:hypothetical protein
LRNRVRCSSRAVGFRRRGCTTFVLSIHAAMRDERSRWASSTSLSWAMVLLITPTRSPRPGCARRKFEYPLAIAASRARMSDISMCDSSRIARLP